MRRARHDILFEPLQIGPKTLKNRFFQVPHCSGFGTMKPGSQAAHRGLKAEGGWGAVHTEYAPVSRDSDDAPDNSSQLLDGEDLVNLKLMTAAAHRADALAGIELAHVGLHAYLRESRWPAVGPSQINSDTQSMLIGKEMEEADFLRIRADFVASALRAREAGFDIVYVHGAQTHLLTQFLSTDYNRRTDRYGGPLENRARFWIEILEDVKAAVGDDCTIASRVGLGLVPGLTIEDTLEFIRLADHAVDLWDVNVGGMALWSHDSGPSRFFRQGHEIEWVGRAREATEKPLVIVGRYTDPDLMSKVLESGKADLIGAARPSIADPFLPNKVRDGRYEDIRECIGCNICASKSISNHLGCTQNATAGEEYRRGWHPERFEAAANADRSVLVVGAGPAGMECAIVLGKRGFERVHLVDREPDVGGALRWHTRLPGLGEWGRVRAWRRVQLSKLPNVHVITGLELGAAEILDYGADIVVCATGAEWVGDGLNPRTRNPIPGADPSAAHVLTPEQVMVEGKRPPGPRVTIVDGEGYFVATGLAELLRLEGFEVDFISLWPSVAPFTDETLEGGLMRQRLHDIGVAMHTEITVESIAADRIAGRGEWDEPFELETDGVVLVTQRRSREGLYRELKAALAEAEGPALYRIGDCLVPRVMADAIFDGHRLGREIDSPDPSVPLPHKRERLVAGVAQPVDLTVFS
jgi:dimethylamine/trimethylamine dehydrogenase